MQLNADYAIHNSPALAAKYWTDLNVSRVKVIGTWDDASVYDVVRTWVRMGGGEICNLALGPSWSDGALAISPLIGKALWVDPGSSSTQLSNKVAYPNFLRTIPTDAQGGAAIAALLHTMGWHNIYILKTDTSYGATLSSGLVTDHTRLGGSVVRTINILESEENVAVVSGVLQTIMDGRQSSRVVVVIDVDINTLAIAARETGANGTLIFVFPEYCSGSTAWSSLEGAFCISIDYNHARFDAFVAAYTARSDAEFNRSAAELYAVSPPYPEEYVIPDRDTAESFTALAADAAWYGLGILQRYQAANGGALPTDTVAAAQFAINSNFTFEEGLTGPVTVTAIGDRGGFLSAVQNSQPNNGSALVATHNGSNTVAFSGAVRVLGNTYNVHTASSAAALQAMLPVDRVVVQTSTDKDLPWYAVLLIALLAFVLFVAAVVGIRALYRHLTRPIPHAHAPKDEREPVAIMFTDIQSSTALWANCPQEMVGALDRHNAVIRECIARFRGYEVKTIGDSFMVAFRGAASAAGCALEIQRALHTADWGASEERTINTFYEAETDAETTKGADPFNGLRVRVGVHFGYVTVRCVARDATGAAVELNGDAAMKVDTEGAAFDYFGSTVNAAARIEACAHGGQVVVSKDLMEAVEAERQAPSTVVSETARAFLSDCARLALGSVALRGLSEELQLVQLSAADLPVRTFPALRLEKAAELDAEESSTHDTASVKSGSTNRTGLSRVGIAQQLVAYAARRRIGELELRQGYFVLDALLSVMKPNAQQRLLDSLLSSWHIDPQQETEQRSGKASDVIKKLALAARLSPVALLRDAKFFPRNAGSRRGTMVSTHSADHGPIIDIVAFREVKSTDSSGGVGTALSVDVPRLIHSPNSSPIM